jgi:hypothetical protein
MAGKGSTPRNCFSRQYRENFAAIDWSDKIKIDPKIQQEVIDFVNKIEEYKKKTANISIGEY